MGGDRVKPPSYRTVAWRRAPENRPGSLPPQREVGGTVGIRERLKLWVQIRATRHTRESAAIAGGRDGERLFEQLIGASHTFNDAVILAGRRIPSRRQGRRREIDLIICTPRMIHLVEVKNWSGHLAVRNGIWRQTRRGGDVVDHGNLITENLARRDAVAEYLADVGVPLDPQYVREHIVPKIIFMNPKLDLDPSIESRPDVLSRRELDAALAKQRTRTSAGRLASSLVDLCLATEAALASTFSYAPRTENTNGVYGSIVARLSETATWDQLRLHGTRALTGDLVVLKVGKKVFRRSDLLETAGPRRTIELKWTRGWFLGLLKVITGIGSLGSIQMGATRLAVSPSDTVTFHGVGDNEPLTRPLVEIDRVTLG